MKVFECQPKGICAKKITVSLSDTDTIEDIKFIGGCKGNAEAVKRLLVGKPVSELTGLADVKCGYKDTSCVAEAAKYLLSVL